MSPPRKPAQPSTLMLVLTTLAARLYPPAIVHAWLSARRAGAHRRRRRTPLVALAAGAALAAAALLPGGGASAQQAGGRTLTFQEDERGTVLKHVGTTKRGPRDAVRMGDLVAFRVPLLAGDGARAGVVSVACLATKGGPAIPRAALGCHADLALADGTLTLQAPVRLGSPVAGAVTGGTGAYANAHGTFSSEGGRFTVVLAP